MIWKYVLIVIPLIKFGCVGGVKHTQERKSLKKEDIDGNRNVRERVNEVLSNTNTDYNCRLYFAKFDNLYGLLSHVNQGLENNPEKLQKALRKRSCAICNVTFSSKTVKLNEHFENHLKEEGTTYERKTINSDMIGITYQRLNLRGGTSSIEGVPCYICGIETESELKHRNHIIVSHWGEVSQRNTRENVCPLCRRFTSENIEIFDKHINEHLKESDVRKVKNDRKRSRNNTLDEILYVNPNEQAQKMQDDTGNGFLIAQIKKEDEREREEKEKRLRKDEEASEKKNPTEPTVVADHQSTSQPKSRRWRKTSSSNEQRPITSKDMSRADQEIIDVDEYIENGKNQKVVQKFFRNDQTDRLIIDVDNYSSREEFFRRDQMLGNGKKKSFDFNDMFYSELEQARKIGIISSVEYVEMLGKKGMADSMGVDDKLSCFPDIISCIEIASHRSEGAGITYLASNMDFFSYSHGDKGWGCGYRNFQMLLSALLKNDTYKGILAEHFKKFDIKDTNAIPSILMLQKMIQYAWDQGFDPDGRKQLGELYNSDTWIGPTEISIALSAMKIKNTIVDVVTKTKRTTQKIIDWVANYFFEIKPFKAPLYLQQSGHSQTIAGIEVLNNNAINVLVLDPSYWRDEMFKIDKSDDESMRLLRFNCSDFTADAYSMVMVDGNMIDEEYEESKSMTNFIVL